MARYLAGESVADICRDTGMSRSALRTYVLATGHAMRQPGSSAPKSATGICLECDEQFTYEFRTGRRSVCDSCLDRKRLPVHDHDERPCPECGRTMHRAPHAARCLPCQRKRNRDHGRARQTHEPRPVTATCNRCGDTFDYLKPPGRGGTRRLCDGCQRANQQSWALKRRAPLRAAYGLQPRPCDYCGTSFQPATASHLYCCRACAAKARRQRTASGKAQPLGLRECAQCGSSFHQTNGRQRFCSDRCRYSAFKAGRYVASVYTFSHGETVITLTSARVSQMKRDFGLDPDKYQAIWRRQRGKCAICRTALRDKPHPHIDHDPKTMQVRGLLCVNCNMALGYLRDDPRVIDRAAAYLRASRQ